jgi:hypothetical protein
MEAVSEATIGQEQGQDYLIVLIHCIESVLCAMRLI